MAKQTLFDEHLQERMQDPAFALAYQRRRLIQEVALAVRQMREQAGLTQAQLAEIISSSQPTIARLERGHDMRAPRFDLLNRIGLALNHQLTLVFKKNKPGASGATSRTRKLVTISEHSSTHPA